MPGLVEAAVGLIDAKALPDQAAVDRYDDLSSRRNLCTDGRSYGQVILTFAVIRVVLPTAVSTGCCK